MGVGGPIGPTRLTYITLDSTSYAHIFVYHAWFDIDGNSRLLPQFRNINSITDLVGRTISRSIGLPTAGGRVYFSANLGFNVGTYNGGYHTTSRFTFIATPTGYDPRRGMHTGRVVTGYPGEYRRDQ